MNFKDWLIDQTTETNILGTILLLLNITIFLILGIAIFLTVIYWPITLIIYTAFLFGYAYYKYKEDTKQ